MTKFTHSIGVLLLLSLIFSVQSAMAQRRPDLPQGWEKLEVAKTTFLSRRIKLTPEEARLFWPVYDKYQEALTELRYDRQKVFLQYLGEKLDGKSDQEINAMIDADISHAEHVLAARKILIWDLRAFLPPRKIAIFLRAEREFNRELQKRLIERRMSLKKSP